ncbi:MAG TPA: hypothetical protein VGB45_06060 [Abditibacterium sp.]|jgi:hypothetical protein
MIQENATQAAAKMWCDDFDADLLKIFPHGEIERLVEPVAGLTLYTMGNQTGGKLNHPSVWNGRYGTEAFFGTKPENSTFKPESYWCDHESAIPCTVLEMLRDWWPHSYNVLLDGIPVLGECSAQMMGLLYHLRGWATLPDGGASHRRIVLSKIARMVERIQTLESRVAARSECEATHQGEPDAFQWFDDSPDAGPNCLCSGCCQPILSIPLRTFSEERKQEARFCQPCAGKFLGIRMSESNDESEDSSDPFWDE